MAQLEQVVMFSVYIPALMAILSMVLGTLLGRRGSELPALLACISLLYGSLIAQEIPDQYSIVGPQSRFLGDLFTPLYGVDEVTRVFMLILGIIATVVVIYSVEYMREDEGYRRYYSLISLFMSSMAGLLLARNLLWFYMFWEIVGLCSFTLIGHYYYSPRVSRAAIKAFFVTRIGDLALLFGILYVYKFAGAMSFEVLSLVSEDVGATFVALSSAAVIAKAAQLPLHVWLPDAMEGPTPVSALLHSATMVKAGAYLAMRIASVPGSTGPLGVLGMIALVTAIYSALCALAQMDSKRLLAYSTINNLALIIATVAAITRIKEVDMYPALLHVEAHAVSKALLFLAVGVALHYLEPLYGPERARLLSTLKGVGRANPALGVVFLLGTASLAGLFPLAGYYSKEAILHLLKSNTTTLTYYMVFVVATLLSVMYALRLAHYTIFARPQAGYVKINIPLVMVAPVFALGLLTIVPPQLITSIEAQVAVDPLGVSAIIIGIVLVMVYYYRTTRLLNPQVVKVFEHGLYIDYMYSRLIAPALRLIAIISGHGLVRLVEESEYAVVRELKNVSYNIRRHHSGRLSFFYAMYTIGLVALLMALLITLWGGGVE